MSIEDKDRKGAPAISRRGFIAGSSALASSLLLSGVPDLAQAQAVGYQQLDTLIPTRDRSRIEVLEFFWFGCPHCYRFEPTINAWKAEKPEDVDFVREAPPLNPAWENHSRTFYAAEALGITDGMFDQTFNEIHQNGNRLRSPDASGKFVESLDLGVDSESFQKAMTSFSVASALTRGSSLARDARVTGVPSMLINGKYLTSSSLAGGNDGMIRVINQLVELERKTS